MESKIRKDLVNYVKENLVNANGTAISKIYTKINDILNREENNDSDLASSNSNDISRYKQITTIENNLKYTNEEELEDINKILNNSAIKESQEDKMIRVALEVVNNILVEMNKNKIQDLCEFVDVQREELTKDKYKQIINDNLEYIFSNGFTRSECMVYQKTIKYPHLSIMKGVLNSIGYELCSKRTNRTINDIKIEDTFYCIKKKGTK
jgi:hypothetical protein